MKRLFRLWRLRLRRRALRKEMVGADYETSLAARHDLLRVQRAINALTVDPGSLIDHLQRK